MANLLLLNQAQPFVGLGTLTFTVPTTGSYYVTCDVTVPSAPINGSGSGSGQGLGAGTGGGAEGFTGGDLGLGHGGVGQGFGVGNGYQQPPAAGSNQTTTPAVASLLSILVKDNGSTVYTAPTLTPTQSALQFRTIQQLVAGHSLTVVIASSGAPDNQLNSVKTIVTVGQGEN